MSVYWSIFRYGALEYLNIFVWLSKTGNIGVDVETFNEKDILGFLVP